MNAKDEALKMAIEALDTLMMEKGSVYQQAINACKEALEQPAQEPVAWTNADELQEIKEGMATCYMYKEPINANCIPLYTRPAQPLNKTAERDYNFMRDLAIGAEELLSKTIKELDEVKELLAQRNLELIAARDMLLNKHME
jgi:hypothetical protein